MNRNSVLAGILIPFLWYAGVALIIPLINSGRNGITEQYLEHALFVILLPLGLSGGISAGGFLIAALIKRFGRRH